MEWIRILLSRSAALFRRSSLDADLDEELRAHIDLAIEEKIKRGAPATEARTSAMREFGGVTQVSETYRLQRGVPFMETLIQDVRYALRQLRKSPGFTLTAVVTLALGIGANTAIFTLVQGILLRSLPVADPAQLYRIGEPDNCCVNGGFVGQNGDFDIFSYDLYLQFKQAAPEFQQLAAVEAGHWDWSVRRGNGLPNELRGEFVSGNFFSTLGVGPYEGRVFTASDDTPSGQPVAVLSYRSWQGEFGGDSAIVGQTISIQAHPFTIIGIAPPSFFGDRVTDAPADLWVPLSTEPYLHGDTSILHHPEQNWLYPIGRVRPGTYIPALQQKLSATLQHWLVTRPVY